MTELAPVVALEGVIRRYDWGSTSAIQTMLGLAPDGRPAAELWFGDHPGAPSPAGDRTLDRLVADDPRGVLGADALERFGPRLPFLLKVLAAQKALSIQVHPDRERARAAFADEQSRGVPLDARERNYADANHKPELLCALTRFEALCGFRPVAQTLQVLDELRLPELEFLSELLRGPDGLRTAFTAVLEHETPALLARAVAARATPDGALRPAWLAAQDFPDDIGVVITLLLNYVVLAPGESIYLGAGIVHAYLRGTGVEIMANSDNVLRCGLTGKHVDVPELLRITDFSELDRPVWAPSEEDGFGATFDVPVPDFRLTRIDVDAYGDGSGGSLACGLSGPQIVLCTAGRVQVESAGTAVEVAPGHAAFVPAREAAYRIAGTGEVFIATTGA